MMKKLLSTMLIFVMSLSLFPVQGWAEEVDRGKIEFTNAII